MRVVRRTGLQGATLAVGLHVALISWLLAGEVPRPAPLARRPPVRVRLVTAPPRTVEPPRPAPKVEPPAPPPAPAPRALRPASPRRPVPRTEAARPEPAAAPIAPAAPIAATPSAPAAPRFSVDISATVSSGGVVVPTAPAGRASPLGVPRWADGAASPGTARPGGRATSGTGPATVEATAASTVPRVTEQPDRDALRRAYPPQARRDGLEGDVRLRILVSTEGRVIEIRVVAAAGSGFDEAATRLARGLRFSPGTKDGRPARVWIPWTFRFRLNG